ncbi:hypothetical protein HPB47_021727 [Ixodes persulcatus]|uniref:Uncharacterized protein n=1 Tax=Ixodes persulcatus TaxID=34615 RepID=A0AC60QBQ4_IXOPE|nr:hypothetical protein HPB47_021727 [Ixodes persulcatus]
MPRAMFSDSFQDSTYRLEKAQAQVQITQIALITLMGLLKKSQRKTKGQEHLMKLLAENQGSLLKFLQNLRTKVPALFLKNLPERYHFQLKKVYLQYRKLPIVQ